MLVDKFKIKFKKCLIANCLRVTSAKNYENRSTCVKVISEDKKCAIVIETLHKVE